MSFTRILGQIREDFKKKVYVGSCNAIALHTEDSRLPPKENVDATFEGGDVDDYLFFYNYDKDIAWIYNNLEDVEYFYV